MTVLFCDMVGSTALSASLDPEDLRSVIATYYCEVAAQVQHFGGLVARRLGDGVLIYFGYPVAHEDDPERAVRAGLALVGAVRGLKLNTAAVLDARVGIETGLVVVDVVEDGGMRERTVLGDTPNLAARLQHFAEPGAVVIGPTTYRLIGRLFECRDLGFREIKGLSSPVSVWQALRPIDSASRFWERPDSQIPVVGRREEFDLLLRRWEQAKTGEGRVVLISGEPGIGKSRLVKLLEEHVSSKPHQCLHYFCSALHRDSALFPIISQIERASNIHREDEAAARHDKVKTWLEPVLNRSCAGHGADYGAAGD